MPASHSSIFRSPRSIQWTFRTLSLVLGLLLLGLGNAAMALQRGDRGNEVSALQTRLAALGCYNSEVTGVFGPMTEAGVKSCQQQFNLTADGIAGPKTMTALNGGGLAPESGTRVAPDAREILLQPGDRGANVTELQQRLQNLGYSTGGVDGVYGEMTAAAVRDFQQSHGMTVDGKFGTPELAKLESSQAPIAQAPVQPSSTTISLGTLTRGDQNSDVTRLQKSLKDAGYFQGETTQYYGSVTQNAVIRFQRDRNLNATGVADAQTLQALGLRSGTSVTSLPPAMPYASNSPFNSSSFTNNRPYDRPATPNARYVVVIPKQSRDTLGQVRQLIGSAQAYSSNKGDYIAAGTFARRSDAEKRSQNLRAYGLDARVDYQ